MPKIVDKSINALEPHEVQRLDELHLYRGSMWPAFELRHYEPDVLSEKHTARVILLREGSSILGWALLFMPHNKWNIHIYIDKNERRKGYGTRLLKFARGKYGSLVTFRWDQASLAFFDANE